MKKRIMVVDDEPAISQVIKSLLEKIGDFEVREENNPLAALRSIAIYKPELVLMDIMMDKKSGPDIVQEMKDSPLLCSTPVVFLTGVVDQQDVENNSGVIGGHPFLSKPIEVQQLIQTVRQLLG